MLIKRKLLPFECHSASAWQSALPLSATEVDKGECVLINDKQYLIVLTVKLHSAFLHCAIEKRGRWSRSRFTDGKRKKKGKKKKERKEGEENIEAFLRSAVLLVSQNRRRFSFLPNVSRNFAILPSPHHRQFTPVTVVSFSLLSLSPFLCHSFHVLAYSSERLVKKIKREKIIMSTRISTLVTLASQSSRDPGLSTHPTPLVHFHGRSRHDFVPAMRNERSGEAARELPTGRLTERKRRREEGSREGRERSWTRREKRREKRRNGEESTEREREREREKEKKKKYASFRERRGAAGKTGSIRAAFESSVAQYLEPFSRN